MQSLGDTEGAVVRRLNRKTRWFLAKEENLVVQKGRPSAVPTLHTHPDSRHFLPQAPTDPGGSWGEGWDSSTAVLWIQE